MDLLQANICYLPFLAGETGIMGRQAGFAEKFDGAQDYDFYIRCVENAKKIHHIPFYTIGGHTRLLRHSSTDRCITYEAGKAEGYWTI